MNKSPHQSPHVGMPSPHMPVYLLIQEPNARDDAETDPPWHGWLSHLEMRFLRKGGYAMSEVSTFRLYILRAMYVFTVVGLAIEKLPALRHPANLSPGDSVILSVLGATALLAVVGVRFPIKMLPLLFFEFVWKAIWILV